MSHTEEKAAEAAEQKVEDKVPQVTAEVTKCPTCGSTKRTGYHNVIERTIFDQRIRWCRTECKDCGQRRVDRLVG